MWSAKFSPLVTLIVDGVVQFTGAKTSGLNAEFYKGVYIFRNSVCENSSICLTQVLPHSLFFARPSWLFGSSGFPIPPTQCWADIPSHVLLSLWGRCFILQKLTTLWKWILSPCGVGQKNTFTEHQNMGYGVPCSPCGVSPALPRLPSLLFIHTHKTSRSSSAWSFTSSPCKLIRSTYDGWEVVVRFNHGKKWDKSASTVCLMVVLLWKIVLTLTSRDYTACALVPTLTKQTPGTDMACFRFMADMVGRSLCFVKEYLREEKATGTISWEHSFLPASFLTWTPFTHKCVWPAKSSANRI